MIKCNRCDAELAYSDALRCPVCHREWNDIVISNDKYFDGNLKENLNALIAYAYRNTRLTFWVFILSQIIGSVTMFNTCCKLVSELIGVSVREQPIYYLIPVILTLIFAVALGIQIFIKAKELKKLKKKMEKTKRKT